MKRFSFRYQTLLEVREREQKQEEELLRHLMGRQYEAEEELKKLQADERAQHDAWLALQGQASLPLDEVTMIQQFLGVIERRIRTQRSAYEEAAARSENQRELLAVAMGKADVIRKLKERDFKAWQVALEAAEAAELDEMATLRFAYVKRAKS